MQERVLANEKIEILWNTECTEAKGDGDLLNEIQIIHNQTQESSSLAVGGLFFAIGHTPNTGFLGGQIETDETGYIITTSRIAFEYLTSKTQLSDEKKTIF
jgi:thioredoxin reductase (NADPH)